MILPPDFEARTLEQLRGILDDIPECADAEMSVVFQGQAPTVRIAFGDPEAHSRPLLMINLVAESKKDPLAPGRLVKGDQMRKVVREWVELYFKLQGVPSVARKVTSDACL